MINIETYNRIKRKHGDYASWAVWADGDEKATSNMANMSILDPDSNPALLETLKTDVIMVALNFAERLGNKKPFGNFHDPYRWAKDFKIRYAFKDTKYWGAYMTDVFKNLPTSNQKELEEYLKSHHEKVEENVLKFRQELLDLGCSQPLILAFGAKAFQIIRENLRFLGLPEEYSRLVKLTHYSHQIGRENYRKAVLNQIAAHLQTPVPT